MSVEKATPRLATSASSHSLDIAYIERISLQRMIEETRGDEIDPV